MIRNERYTYLRLDICIRHLYRLSIIVAKSINVMVTSHNVPPCSRHFPPFPAIFRHFLPISIFYLAIFTKLSLRKLLNYRIITRQE